MPSKRQSILVVDPDSASRRVLEELVRSAGYDVAVSSSQAEGFKFVQEASIDLLLLSADLADIQCCDALAEVKGNAATAGTRVILLTQGGGAERARGLDLGADEVLTSPWEAAELLARVRVQLKEKHAFDELREKTRIADEGREMAQTAFQALAVTEKMTRDAFSLGRALKIGVSVLFAVAMLIAGIFLLYSRRADKEASRAYSVIAQLERGAHRQEQLMADARNARADLRQSDVLEQRQQLKQQSDELRQKISGAGSGDVSTLQKQLEETTTRLKRVETEAQSAEQVIRAYAPSVCLLHVSVSFVDQASGRPLRVPVSISEISEEADLAVLKGDLSGLKKPILRMDASKEAAVSGQPLLSLGYATGISAILARAGEDAANDIAKTTGGKPREVVDELLRRKLIRPLVTQGHIGDVLPDKIVYDAQTTSGSSGGPLINREGEVIGVTFAVVKGFGGSNFGVPIRFAQPLLKP